MLLYDSLKPHPVGDLGPYSALKIFIKLQKFKPIRDVDGNV